MGAPIIRIAVRNAAGEPLLFRIQHEAITSYEQAVEATKNELPDALVILALVPKGE